MKKEFRLCYIYDRKCYFTDSFDSQWGDDWNDAPYDCNAGEPYSHNGESHKILFFDLPEWRAPCDFFYSNSHENYVSVRDINEKKVPWITCENRDGTKDGLYAGATLKEFARFIKKHGGIVYKLIT